MLKNNKMKFDNDNEKKLIRRAVRNFLQDNNTNLGKLAGAERNSKYSKIFTGHIQEDDVNEVIHMVDPEINLIRDEHGNFEIR